MSTEAGKAATAAISFEELLAANEAETLRWQQWFAQQPASILDVPIDIAEAGSVRNLLLHIFAVELRYAERLLDEPVTPYEKLPTGTVDELFASAARARTMYREYLSKATPEDLGRVLEFPTRTAGTLRASKRKIFLHAMIHGVRHWAQLATALRAAGHKTDWAHDFLMSPTME